jgi:ABC-type uncharacterized transport system ATPase subunit
VSVPLLEAEGLTMRFGGVTALDGVDFALGARELRCLIGPNGAGKSTFFKCLTGQLAPSAGSVRLRGREIAGARSFEVARAGIGIKTQVPAVFDALSVAENLWLAARRRLAEGPARRAAQDMLERLGVAALATRPAGALAHGQRQFVELAMVLVQEPALILLDEPTAGMTREEVERIAALAQELAHERALIVIEHDVRFVATIAETVTVFHEGRVLAEDSVERVMADPRVRAVYLGAGGARDARG